MAQEEGAVELANPEASSTPTCSWDEQWARFTVAESIATASMAAGILVTQLALPDTERRLTGGVLLDDGTRDLLRADTLSAQHTMASVSDALLYALMVMPFADAAIAWVAHDAPEVAAEMVAMNTQSMALTFLVTQVTKWAFGRARPYQAACLASAGDDPEAACPDESGHHESFLSGHTSMAFTSAGLICAHHENLPLYGGGAADPAACVMALAAATTVGTLRMTADRHYLSDVIMGAALGLVSGYALPSFLHYDIGETDPRTGRPENGRVAPVITSGGAGFGYEHVWY